MTTIETFKRGSLHALIVVVMVLGMMTGCASSTDEGGNGSGDCDCAEGDFNCQDRCHHGT